MGLRAARWYAFVLLIAAYSRSLSPGVTNRGEERGGFGGGEMAGGGSKGMIRRWRMRWRYRTPLFEYILNIHTLWCYESSIIRRTASMKRCFCFPRLSNTKRFSHVFCCDDERKLNYILHRWLFRMEDALLCWGLKIRVKK